ncbi:hypothetical protein EC988_005583 [Linderina pennispora]|nr:hypothetical protein EC988_005583 [Linderina pennispora]
MSSSSQLDIDDLCADYVQSAEVVHGTSEVAVTQQLFTLSAEMAASADTASVVFLEVHPCDHLASSISQIEVNGTGLDRITIKYLTSGIQLKALLATWHRLAPAAQSRAYTEQDFLTWSASERTEESDAPDCLVIDGFDVLSSENR